MNHIFLTLRFEDFSDIVVVLLFRSTLIRRRITDSSESQARRTLRCVVVKHY